MSRNNGLLPNSIRIISSCLKTVSSNATSVASTVRSAGASVAASISVASEDRKDQVLWAGFDKLELGPSTFKHVLLLGYSNGFQVLDVEDAAHVSELVSKRDGPVTFLQILPIPVKSAGHEGFGSSHPLLLVVGGEETNSSGVVQGGAHSGGPYKGPKIEPQAGKSLSSPTAVRFYSLRSHSYVHVLRFRSAIYMVRCSPHIVAVGLAAQIYCFDALTLENKFSVLTYPVPQGGIQGEFGVNIGYGPMAVGPRWLAYASNSPISSSTGRLSPQILSPSPGVSPSTSPSNGSLMARYAMESSKHLAAGLINLGDMGYKTLSRYYQEFLPDGSNSPVSSNSSYKVGRNGSTAHSNEIDSVGMVVVKDFISKAVISQFRAHSSPISALCFDPSGTLLVTASVHGNNINIFRIMPSTLKNGSGTTSYDWSCSHIHLYKLHRGMTAAVIQDICFSQYSQWAAIVSSRGTAHIFVLSPFGGDTDFQTQTSHSDVPVLLPGLSLPWWSTSSFVINQQSFAPPSPVTLSVVSRLKDGNSGWLNTVTNAAVSATGKLSIPSGAIAAIFHNSVAYKLQSSSSKINAFEHLLVYTPSGHLVQHELVPSLGIEPSEGDLRTGTGSSVQMQDEELKVKAEPIQWWDVCRRSDWPEREEYISRVTLDRQNTADIGMDSYDSEDSDVNSMEFNSNISGRSSAKPHERLHFYLSNAEVQISSGRVPIWQKSKISVYAMFPLRANERKLTQYDAGGEIEIEKIPSHEVEIRRKDLLPVFDHFHSVKSNWNDRGFIGAHYRSTSSFESHRTKDKFAEETVVSRSKPSSLVSVESSDGGSARTTESLIDADPKNTVRGHIDQPTSKLNNARNGYSISSPLVSTTFSKKGYVSSESCEVPNGSLDQFSSSTEISAKGSATKGLQDQSSLGLYFQDGYYKASEVDESHELTGFVIDTDSSSGHLKREKPEEDGDSDDMLGGVFDFSEDG